MGTVLSDAMSAIGLQIAIYHGLVAAVAFRRHLLESPSKFLLMGVFPLLGALFMFWIFGESIPNLGLMVDVIGLGAMALGFIPLIAYRHSAYLHQKPTLGRSLAAPEPALDAQTIVG